MYKKSSVRDLSKSKRNVLIILSILILSSFIPIKEVQNFYADNKNEISTTINYTHHDPIIISYNKNFTDYGFEGSGTLVDPYRIENLNITEIDNSRGIIIEDTSYYFVIQNCYVSTKDDGILVSNISTSTGLIKNNIIFDSTRRGMRIVDSPGIIISGNEIRDCYESSLYITSSPNSMIDSNIIVGLGPLIGGPCIFVESSPYALITNNIISEGPAEAILLTSSSSSIITENTCSDVAENGIWIENESSDTIVSNNFIEHSKKGIYSKDSHRINIFNNTCFENQVGVQLYRTDYPILKYNIIHSNSKNGIEFGSSVLYGEISFNNISLNTLYGVSLSDTAERNTIHHNYFFRNNIEGTSQALDDGKDNTWYEEETEEGNFWSMWEKSKPYLIDGDAESEDLFPLNEELKRANLQILVILPFIIILNAIIYSRKKKYS